MIMYALLMTSVQYSCGQDITDYYLYVLIDSTTRYMLKGFS